MVKIRDVSVYYSPINEDIMFVYINNKKQLVAEIEGEYPFAVTDKVIIHLLQQYELIGYFMEDV